MKKERYTIDRAIETVAMALKDSDDHSETTIRCAINDMLDGADKDGYAVNFDYDQRRAVIKTRMLIGQL